MLKGYTSKEAIENYMLIDIDDSFDDQIDEWMETVEEYIDNTTNRDFTPVAEDAVAEDRTFDGDGTKTLVIDAATEITEVRFSETGDPIDAENYITTPIRKDTITGLKLKYLVFPCGTQNIYVKAKWGYAAVPKQVKMAATILMAGIIKEAYASEGEVQSVSVGRYQVTYRSVSEQATKHPEVDEMLQFNKRFTF
jgi:hypothetical protein